MCIRDRPYTEVVSALQTNMIEGLTNDIFGYTYYDLPRLTKYMFPIPFGLCPHCLLYTSYKDMFLALPQGFLRSVHIPLSLIHI